MSSPRGSPSRAAQSAQTLSPRVVVGPRDDLGEQLSASHSTENATARQQRQRQHQADQVPVLLIEHRQHLQRDAEQRGERRERGR